MTDGKDDIFTSPDLPMKSEVVGGKIISEGATTTDDMTIGEIGIDKKLSSRDATSIIAARGTSDGLILRIDGRVQFDSLEDALRSFLEERKKFFSGNPVFLEWVGEVPEALAAEGIKKIIEQEFGIKIKKSSLKPAVIIENADVSSFSEARSDKTQRDISLRVIASESRVSDSKDEKVKVQTRATDKLERGYVMTSYKNDEGKEDSLFGGISSFPQGSDVVPTTTWDEPNARLVTATLRSGQRIESEHSVVVLGDVNSGAEVVAGGDVIIMGALRGVAHAGAYDETGGEE